MLQGLTVLRLNAKIAFPVLLDYFFSKVECKYGGLIRGGIGPKQFDTSLLSCVVNRRVRIQRTYQLQGETGIKE